MKYQLLAATAFVLTGIAGIAPAQVPPDIAAEIEKIGHVVDVPNTSKLYVPLFGDMTPRYQGVSVKRDVSYGPDTLNTLDVFTSGEAGAKRPVVVYVHGGGFERGDKIQNGTPFYDNVMLFAVNNGYVGVNMNYRLAPKDAWPAAHEDMAAVVRWIKANIGAYGGDPDRIVLWGQSAGASLIAGYLAHPQFWGPSGHGISGAVLNSGFYVNDADGSNYFGHDPKELAERSSLEGMKKLDIPLFVSHTTVDLLDAITQAEDANKALCAIGKCPTFAVFKDHSHVSQNYSVGTGDISVSGPILAFIKKAVQ